MYGAHSRSINIEEAGDLGAEVSSLSHVLIFTLYNKR